MYPMTRLAIALGLSLWGAGLAEGSTYNAVEISGTFQQPVERIVQDAMRELDGVEKAVKRMRDGDSNGARRYLNRLRITSNKLKSAKDQKHPAWIAAAKRFNALQKTLQAKGNAGAGGAPPTGDVPAGLKDVSMDVRMSFARLKRERPQDLATPATQAKWKQRFANWRKQLSAFPPEDPNVQTVEKNIKILEDGFAKNLAAYQGRKASTEALKILTAKYQSKNLPKPVYEPYEPETLKAWTTAVLDIINKQIPEDVATLEKLASNPDVDKQRLASARRWIGQDTPRKLEGNLRGTAAAVDGKAESLMWACNFVLETDPSNQNHVANRILNKGGTEKNMGRLRDALDAIALAEMMDGLLKRTDGPDRAAQRKKANDAIAHLKKCAVIALDQVRMPKAASTDAELLAAAEETLKRKKYGVNGWERLVISYPKEHREKKSGSISHGTVSSSVTLYHYKWDEFVVTTAEKDGDEVYLWVNKLRYYTSGGSTTPLNKWIVSERWQSTRILPENIKK